MKKILIIVAAVTFALTACKKDFGDLNDNPKQYFDVPPSSLFTNAQSNLADAITTPNVNSGIFRLLAQYWTETTYIDETNYDLATRNIPRNFWNTMYRDVLKDFSEAKKLIEKDNLLNATTKANQLALVDIMEVYSYSILVNTYGDIPYSEALDINNVQPKYDDAATVYADLLNRLNTDITNLNVGGESFGTADLLYGGDVARWKKFANSLKLKMGMTLADVNNAVAKTVVESAVTDGVFSSAADNAVFHYLTAPPNTNPVWVDLVQSGRQDFVAANTLVDVMNTLNDPRVPYYFTKDANDNYTGGIYGTNNNYATFSKPSTKITAPEYETLFLDFIEVEFLLAEAVERGYTVSGTAESHYNTAITESILYWGGLNIDANSYLLNPSVAYSTAIGTYQQKIGTQKWIALYNRGIEAWTEWRRLDFPALVAPVDALSAIPVRFPYSDQEQNLNKANYTAAAAAIGGDLVTTKIFWDIN